MHTIDSAPQNHSSAGSSIFGTQNVAAAADYELSNGDLSSLKDEDYRPGDSIQPLKSGDGSSLTNDLLMIEDSEIELELNGGGSWARSHPSKQNLHSSLHSLDLDDIKSVESAEQDNDEREELAMERSYGSGIYHSKGLTSPGGKKKSPSISSPKGVKARTNIAKGLAKLCALPDMIVERNNESSDGTVGSISPPSSPLYTDSLQVRGHRGKRPTRRSFKQSRRFSNDSMSSIGMLSDDGAPSKPSSFLSSISSLYGGQNEEKARHNSLDSLGLGSNSSLQTSSSSMTSMDSNNQDNGKGAAPSSMYGRMLGALQGGSSHTKAEEDDDVDDSCYTLGDHADFLHVARESEPLGCYYCDIGHLCLGDYKDSQHIPRLVKDYLWPVPLGELSKFFRGLKLVPKEESSPSEASLEPLPVRTVAFRLRPDVSSVKIIDAIKTSFEESIAPGEQNITLYSDDTHHRVLRFSSSIAEEPVSMDDDPDVAATGGEDKSTPKLIPYTVDAQVCLQNTECFERYLVLRVFYPTSKEMQGVVEGQLDSSGPVDSVSSDDRNGKSPVPSLIPQDVTLSTNHQLRQASSLVQLFFKNSTESTPSPKSSPTSTSAHLMYHYDSSKSVQDVDRSARIEGGTVWPALNANDWELIQISEPMCEVIWKSLLSSGVYFSSITKAPLGKFLNIVDPDYCRDLEKIAKESSMIEELRQAKVNAMMKHATVMEEKYANFLRVINPMWELYGLQFEPAIQKTGDESPSSDGAEENDVPLMELVKNVAQHTVDSNAVSLSPISPESLVDSVIKAVYRFIEEHLDHAFRDSCKRLNSSVTSRLQRTQAHQREMVRRLESADSKAARKYSEDFNRAGLGAKNIDGQVSKTLPFGFPILVLDLWSPTGGGKCYVTTAQLLYHMPGRLLGQKTILDLKHIEFQVTGNALTVLKAASSEKLLKLHPTEVTATELHVFFETLRFLH
jgi:hypothetical protein